MAEIVSPINFPQRNIQDQSFLVGDVAAAANSFTVSDPSEWSTDDYIVVGIPGQDGAQLVQVQSVSGQIVTINGTLEFKHYDREMVTRIYGNQIITYAAAAPVDNSIPDDSAAMLINGPTDIEADEAFTSFNYTLGGSGYWYKYVFKNETTGSIGALADTEWVRGGNFGHLTTPDMVRIEAGLQGNVYITNDIIQEAIEDAEGQVKSSIAIGGYSLPLADNKAYGLARKAAKLLAAGYLLTSSNTNGYSDVYKQGQDKIAQATVITDKFEAGSVVMLDQTDTEATRTDNGLDISGPVGDIHSSHCDEPWFGRNTKL